MPPLPNALRQPFSVARSGKQIQKEVRVIGIKRAKSFRNDSLGDGLGFRCCVPWRRSIMRGLNRTEQVVGELASCLIAIRRTFRERLDTDS